MRRTVLGILALVFLMAAGGIFLRGLAHEYTLALSVCLRMGLGARGNVAGLRAGA